jgi:polysaccharide biosynthesis protein PelC
MQADPETDERQKGPMTRRMMTTTKLRHSRTISLLALLVCILPACFRNRNMYHDRNMDFGVVQSVAVLPFANLSRDNGAAERVRDVFITGMLATQGAYVVPVGDVARAASRVGLASPTNPSAEDVVKLAALLKVQAVVTGVVREYGEVRSGTSGANVISVSLQMLEADTGKIVFSASSTKGGVSFWNRMFGGGGRPMNLVTEQAVDDLIEQLFK